MFQVTAEVTAEDLTPIYKHVHHAQSMRFLELARHQFMESIGYPNEALIARGCFLVLTKLTVNYLRELKEGPIVITCEDARVEGRNLLLRQKILNSRGKTALCADLEMAGMSPETKRAVDLPREFLDNFCRG